MEPINDPTEFYLGLLEKNLRTQNSFLSLSSPNPHFKSNVKNFSTTFTNAIIMMNIMKSNSLSARKIVKTLNRYVKKQRNKQLSFNYWDKNVDEYKNIPYPDDLDDTFCALTALHEYDDSYLTGKDMRRIIELLVHQEAEVGGPYYTWITDGDDIEWRDIDLAVNSNIAYFLSRVGIDLPNISNLVEKAIDNDRINSRYYPQSSPVAYFISKWYQGPKKTKLVAILEKMYDLPSSTFLDKLLVSISLVRHGQSNHPNVQRTFEILSKSRNIANKAYPFYRGVNPNSDGMKYFSGSPSLTLSFAVEFLTLHDTKISSKKRLIDSDRNKLAEVNRLAFESAESELRLAKGEIQKCGLDRLKVMSKNPDMAMITAIPCIAYSSLKTKKKIKKDILDALSLATLFGWLAYDIYDDFFDNHGTPAQLSVANFALRKLSSIFTSEYLPRDFHEYFHRVMAVVDNANAKESNRVPVKFHRGNLIIDKKLFSTAKSINKLHEKSIAHVLGVVAIYSLLKKSTSSSETSSANKFFENYLSARQMIDDMHDWEEDLSMGKLNSSSAQMVIFAYESGIDRLSINQLRLLFLGKNCNQDL